VTKSTLPTVASRYCSKKFPSYAKVYGSIQIPKAKNR